MPSDYLPQGLGIFTTQWTLAQGRQNPALGCASLCSRLLPEDNSSLENRTQLAVGEAESSQASAGRLIFWLALVLTLLTYIGCLRFEFVYDDLSQIVGNPHVQSWRYVPSYFTEQVWGHRYPGQPGDYYRPFFLLWLLLDYTLFGLRPGGWHGSVLLLHLLTTGLVYLLACRLTKDRITAGMAALFFGLHPAHIEAVAWVSAVCEPLMAAAMIGSLLCYLRQRELPPGRKKSSLEAASLFLFLIAVLSKETALVLPTIIAAYEWLFPRADATGADASRRPSWSRLARAVTPFVLVLAVDFAVRFRVLKGIGRSSDKSLSEMLLTWPYLLWFYLRELVWPVKISTFYETYWVNSPGLRNFALPLLAVIAAAVALGLWAWRSRLVAFSAIWMAVAIFPPLWGIRYFGERELAHDRYLYLPSVGFALLLAVAIRKLHQGRAQLFGQPALQVAAAAIVTCFLGIACAAQSVYWANNLMLYARGVQVAPRNVMAWDHLGTEWMAHNRRDLALEMYQRAYALEPDDWNTNLALGITYYTAGDLTQADRFLSRACELRSGYANQYYYLAELRLQMGRVPEAEVALRKALQIWPTAPGWHQKLGVVLEQEGDLVGARDQFQAELANNPASDARQQLDEVQARLRTTSAPATSPDQKR